jgi:hypothetical protein
MPPQKNVEKVAPLNLEVQEIEQFCSVGCGTSTTRPSCTCPVHPSTTGSLFTARTVA